MSFALVIDDNKQTTDAPIQTHKPWKYGSPGFKPNCGDVHLEWRTPDYCDFGYQYSM